MQSTVMVLAGVIPLYALNLRMQDLITLPDDTMRSEPIPPTI
jgi:hypothetical protein